MKNKVPIFCSLIPTELLINKGYSPFYISPDDLPVKKATACGLHDNICSYVKSLCDHLLENENEYGLIVIPASCDAMKKMYCELGGKISSEKLFLLDFPKIKTKGASKILAHNLLKLWERLDVGATLCGCPCSGDPQPYGGAQHKGSPLQTPPPPDKIEILGANVGLKVIVERIENFGFDAHHNHCMAKFYPDERLMGTANKEHIAEYATELIRSNKCPRTLDDKYKHELIDEIKALDVKGIIFNTYKFCDFQNYDYNFLKHKLKDIPMILIEHERQDSSGQIATRVDAFLEGIKMNFLGSKSEHRIKREGYHIGIDSGSHTTKLVCIDESAQIIHREVMPTGISVIDSANKLMENCRSSLKDDRQIQTITATGYGRSKISFATRTTTEISCHASGAFHLTQSEGTLIDIGGQDSKVIRINPHGAVAKFAMNDKCAAGTGRFLEVIANRLGASLEEFSKLSQAAKEGVAISSMCSVFAESEVISLIASGNSTENIARGIHEAIASRTSSMVLRIEKFPPFFMSGGAALNKSLVGEIEKAIGSKIQVLDFPQLVGALGAALIGLRGI